MGMVSHCFMVKAFLGVICPYMFLKERNVGGWGEDWGVFIRSSILRVLQPKKGRIGALRIRFWNPYGPNPSSFGIHSDG